MLARRKSDSAFTDLSYASASDPRLKRWFIRSVEGLSGRLGDEEQQLRDGLAQLRIAFVQIKTASEGGGPAAE